MYYPYDGWYTRIPGQSYPPFPPGGQGYPPFPPGGQGQGYPPFPPGGQGQGYPPFPPGGQGQGYPPFPPGDQSQSQVGPPQGPPPSHVPKKPAVSLYAVDAGGIRRCLYRYTYVWLQNGRSFWFYPVYVGRDSIAGYRWKPNQYRWTYTGFDLRTIEYFECS